MDAFDRFWHWANKPPESPLTIPAELHRTVMKSRLKTDTAARRSTKPQRTHRIQAMNTKETAGLHAYVPRTKNG